MAIEIRVPHLIATTKMGVSSGGVHLCSDINARLKLAERGFQFPQSQWRFCGGARFIAEPSFHNSDNPASVFKPSGTTAF